MNIQGDLLADTPIVNTLFDASSFGKKIKLLRQALSISQLVIADDLGVSRKLITDIENGNRVSPILLQKYINILGKAFKNNGEISRNLPFLNKEIKEFENTEDKSMQFILQLMRDSLSHQRDIIISIKPEYSKKILEGRKTIELRRKFPIQSSQGSTAYIYSTSPIRALVGSVRIYKVEKLSISKLWKTHGKSASITKLDFDDYFHDLDNGYALYLDGPRSFSRPLELSELNKKFGFCAPQSFLYANGFLKRALENEFKNFIN